MAVSVTALVHVPGLHRWPDAHNGRKYLRAPHRHLFHVRATVAVAHNQRDVEFHDLARLVWMALDKVAPSLDVTLRDFGTRSCEAMAGLVAEELITLHGLDALEVSVSEDDEFTATWTKD